jgi:peptidyl-prolyl cis-trans isomerase SurA
LKNTISLKDKYMIISRLLATLTILLFVFFSANAQSKSDILFSVEGKKVDVEEFDYIYRKTNGAQATYSRESLKEYLDLYVKFKLKVQKAKDMKLDTIMALSRELEDYRRQLADTYLVDKEVTDKLLDELYKRMQTEREVSHILFNFKQNATAADSAEVYERAARVLDMVRKIGDFDRMALSQSEDPNVRENKGNLGFLSAMLPNGFYDLENTIYNTPVGKVSEPVLSPMGLHIIKVLKERPARGEIEVAHILIRDPMTSPISGAEQRIIEIWTELNDGAQFESLATRYSEDLTTANKGGYLGFFGINRYEQAFEDGAFSLQSDGQFSNPIRSRIGWHIIKRISLKELEPLPKIRGRLAQQVKMDSRFERARREMIDRVKAEAQFAPVAGVLEKYMATLDKDFLSYKWKGSDMPETLMFTMAPDAKVNTGDFTEFLLRNQRKRLQMSRDSNIVETATVLYEDFVDEVMIKFAERKLESKYPEFKALMREYEEGILLFEVSKMQIWDKASQDTVGLAAFHKQNNDRYMWEERMELAEYRINTADQKVADKVFKFAMKNPSPKVVKKFNKKEELVSVNIRMIEKSNYKPEQAPAWNQGAMTSMTFNEKDKKFAFSAVDRLVPPKHKTLNESRGPAIADYQDYLEKEWVKALREKYKVEINEAVFNQMVK